MQTNIFTELKNEYRFLSRVEKTIADMLLKNPKEFVTCSITELSQKLKVSQGSINNFANKFSCGGFSALKLKVAEQLSSREPEPFAIINKSKSIKSAMELKIKETTAAFYNTLEINDEQSLKNAVDKILKAKKIEIYGIFNSGIVAKNFCYQLIQLGIPATAESDTLMCAVSASMLNKDCLAIAISSSGRTKEIIDTVKIAKANNVPVISLTCNKFSPLAKLSDDVLISTASGMSISDKNDEVISTQLLILDTLCAYLRSVIDESGKKHYYKLQNILNSHSIKD